MKRPDLHEFIRKRLVAGDAFHDIAAELKLTRQRVHQIFPLSDLSSDELAVRISIIRERKERERRRFTTCDCGAEKSPTAKKCAGCRAIDSRQAKILHQKSFPIIGQCADCGKDVRDTVSRRSARKHGFNAKKVFCDRTCFVAFAQKNRNFTSKPSLHDLVDYICLDCRIRFSSRLKKLDVICPNGHIHVVSA